MPDSAPGPALSGLSSEVEDVGLASSIEPLGERTGAAEGGEGFYKRRNQSHTVSQNHHHQTVVTMAVSAGSCWTVVQAAASSVQGLSSDFKEEKKKKVDLEHLPISESGLLVTGIQ